MSLSQVLEAKKKSAATLAARQLGSRPYQERIFKADVDLAGHIALVLSLPELQLDPAQDNDPDSPTFGQWTFDIDVESA